MPTKSYQTLKRLLVRLETDTLVCGRVPWLSPVLAGWVYAFVGWGGGGGGGYVQEHLKAQKSRKRSAIIEYVLLSIFCNRDKCDIVI